MKIIISIFMSLLVHGTVYAKDYQCQTEAARWLQGQSRSAEIVGSKPFPGREAVEQSIGKILRDEKFKISNLPEKNRALLMRWNVPKASRTIKAAFNDFVTAVQSPGVDETIEYRRGDAAVKAGVEKGRITTIFIGDTLEKMEVLKFDSKCRLHEVGIADLNLGVTPEFCAPKVMAEFVEFAEEAKDEDRPDTEAELCKFQCGEWKADACVCPGAKVDKDWKFRMHGGESTCCPIRRLTQRDLLIKLADKHKSHVDVATAQNAVDLCNKYFVNKNPADGTPASPAILK